MIEGCCFKNLNYLLFKRENKVKFDWLAKVRYTVMSGAASRHGAAEPLGTRQPIRTLD